MRRWLLSEGHFRRTGRRIEIDVTVGIGLGLVVVGHFPFAFSPGSTSRRTVQFAGIERTRDFKVTSSFGGEELRQSQARSAITSQLEHKSTRQVAISARNNPSATKSGLRMVHLLSLKEAGPNLLKISESCFARGLPGSRGRASSTFNRPSAE